ncbi:MAG: hypothetical protein AB1921_09265 [Thermodesulfobacteriota bacterium]
MEATRKIFFFLCLVSAFLTAAQAGTGLAQEKVRGAADSGAACLDSLQSAQSQAVKLSGSLETINQGMQSQKGEAKELLESLKQMNAEAKALKEALSENGASAKAINSELQAMKSIENQEKLLDEKLGDYFEAIDRFAYMLEKYGYVTISTPILTRPQGNDFYFNLDLPGTTYFDEAKKQVNAFWGSSIGSSLTTELAFKGTMDEVQKLTYDYALEAFRKNWAMNRKAEQLLYDAATDRYEAAVALAGQMTDAQEKKQALAQAKTEFAQSVAGIYSPTMSAPLASGYTQLGLPAFLTGKSGDTGYTAGGGVKSLFNEIAKSYFGDNVKLTISNSDAIRQAASDKAVESIFRVISQPERAQAFKGKTCLFGIAMVSVAPGWKTQENFAADLSVMVKFKLDTARLEVRDRIVEYGYALKHGNRKKFPELSKEQADESLRFLHNKELIKYMDYSGALKDITAINMPLVAAVSPMTDLQVMDQVNQQQRQLDLTMNLAGKLASMGYLAEAQAFLKYVEKMKKEFATRTPEAIVSSFSEGNLFGYQIGPSFTAMSEKKVLGRKSFPVLLIIGLDTNDILVPWLCRNEDSGKMELAEPYLLLEQSANWIPMNKGCCFSRNSRRLSESDILANYLALSKTEDDIRTIFKGSTPSDALFTLCNTVATKAQTLLSRMNEASIKLSDITVSTQIYDRSISCMTDALGTMIDLLSDNIDMISGSKVQTNITGEDLDVFLKQLQVLKSNITNIKTNKDKLCDSARIKLLTMTFEDAVSTGTQWRDFLKRRAQRPMLSLAYKQAFDKATYRWAPLKQRILGSFSRQAMPIEYVLNCLPEISVSALFPGSITEASDGAPFTVTVLGSSLDLVEKVEAENAGIARFSKLGGALMVFGKLKKADQPLALVLKPSTLAFNNADIYCPLITVEKKAATKPAQKPAGETAKANAVTYTDANGGNTRIRILEISPGATPESVTAAQQMFQH